MEQGGGVLKLGETPIGPTWDIHHYFLGADTQGRDVMARLLYGGRSSLAIGIGSALLACLIATVLALIAGFYSGLADSLLSRLMDVDLGVSRDPVRHLRWTVLLTAPNGLELGPIHIVATSLWLPTLIIGFIYVPYVYRPVRGSVLSVVEKEFVEAAVATGRVQPAADLLGDPPERDHRRHRADAAHDRDDDPHRGGALVPRGGRPAAGRELGHDHQRRPEPALHPAVGGDRPRDHDRPHRARAERARRRDP